MDEIIIKGKLVDAENHPIEGEIDLDTNGVWYENLLEDLKDVFVETSFTSRWALIEGYHKVGERIVQDEGKSPDLVQRVADDLKKSKRSIYYAVQFFKKFPNLNRLPEGKNTLWRDITQKYLPEAPKELDDEKPLKKTAYEKFADYLNDKVSESGGWKDDQTATIKLSMLEVERIRDGNLQ